MPTLQMLARLKCYASLVTTDFRDIPGRCGAKIGGMFSKSGFLPLVGRIAKPLASLHYRRF
ncbi:MAG: hypothetical protein CO108_11210 [Deltaproteobacteria bacterium CG_4_9_14_3_um_filter_63_12]|nr:MAG: hypothetical protein COW42_15830 [Deltaproteobacteria bacterium CG17_big_fil_post_rev_8_21_14_2_50_63_7]PJB42745.1 MAG: hypothetical protein CO108_11210 [Deltaproteobacteria bacterium CG_4_9_14_3_um_filter_63_12]